MDNNENKTNQILAAINELKLDFNNPLGNMKDKHREHEEHLFAITTCAEPMRLIQYNNNYTSLGGFQNYHSFKMAKT